MEINEPYRGQVPVRPSADFAEEMGLEILEVQKVTDTTGMKVLRIFTYILVNLTCVVLLVFLFKGLLLVNDMQEAVDSWLRSFTTSEILGD